MTNNEVFVTQPFLPSLEEFIPYLQGIWERKILTNGGPCHQELERSLSEYLGTPYISLFTNGALALVTALQALRISGEVITTPYSFVATAHSLIWNGVQPVFVDVDPKTLNMNPERIEAAITPRTTAILPVHCYGHPCDVQAIQSIADRYNLRVIYDAAHAFGVRDSGGSVLRHGDLSILSFHATKVFSTFEGGAIISPDLKTKKHIDHLKNFGIADEVTVIGPGINGKMSEVHAAFGLLQLQHIQEALLRRSRIDEAYRSGLSEVPGIRCLESSGETLCNYAYFPILINPEYHETRDNLYYRLRANGVFARRYFYPLISDFPVYSGLHSARRENLPVAAEASAKVLCLPIYPALAEEDLVRIINIIKSK